MTRPMILDLALILAVTAAFWSAPLLARPTLPFGVRVPATRVREPAILRARRRYARGVTAIGALACLTLVVASTVLELGSGRQLVLPILIVVCCLLGYHAHRSVSAAKRAGDWYAGLRQGITVDTSLRTDPVRPPWLLLSPAVLITAITGGLGVLRYGDLPATLPTPNGMTVDADVRSTTTVSFAFATVTAQILIVVLVALLAIAIPRSRPDLDAEQPAASATRYRAYLEWLLRLLLLSAGCATASLLVASLQVWEVLQPNLLVTLLSYLPLLAALVAWAIFAVRVGDAGHRMPAAEEDPVNTRQVQRDDDRHWHLAGMVYVNRDDPAVLVHRRVGTYFTLNLGNPVSWLVLLAVAAIAVLAGTGVIELPERG